MRAHFHPLREETYRSFSSFWCSCYSLTLFFKQTIISSQQGLVWLSKSQYSGISLARTFVMHHWCLWCFNSKLRIIFNDIIVKGSSEWREVKCEALSSPLLTVWSLPTVQKHRLSAQTWNRKCRCLRKCIIYTQKLLEKQEKKTHSAAFLLSKRCRV